MDVCMYYVMGQKKKKGPSVMFKYIVHMRYVCSTNAASLLFFEHSPVEVGMLKACCVAHVGASVLRDVLIWRARPPAKGTQTWRMVDSCFEPGTTTNLRFRIVQSVSFGDTCSWHGTRTRHGMRLGYPFIYPGSSWGLPGARLRATNSPRG